MISPNYAECACVCVLCMWRSKSSREIVWLRRHMPPLPHKEINNISEGEKGSDAY